MAYTLFKYINIFTIVIILSYFVTNSIYLPLDYNKMAGEGSEGFWRTPAFRQIVASKIDEAIRQSGINPPRNAIEMENHVFLKAKTKDEYLGYTARLILHLREMSKKCTAMGANQDASGKPDPINAPQNLASQSTPNQMINMPGPQQGPIGGPQQSTATNPLQTLNRGPDNQMPNN